MIEFGAKRPGDGLSRHGLARAARTGKQRRNAAAIRHLAGKAPAVEHGFGIANLADDLAQLTVLVVRQHHLRKLEHWLDATCKVPQVRTGDTAAGIGELRKVDPCLAIRASSHRLRQLDRVHGVLLR